MSTTEDSTNPDWIADSLDGPDRLLELTFAYDDPDDPSIVTVYPEGDDDRTTTWISVDLEHAVSLEAAR